MRSRMRKRLSLPDRLFRYLERRSLTERIIIGIVAAAFIFSGIAALLQINDAHLTEVPKRGGELHIGVVGAPRFVNPVLAITRADHDLVELTYAGLMKINAQGNLVNDLAKNITVSDDGLTYNIELNTNRFFHDGTPITADDVAYTIDLIQNPELKSPLRGNWSGVKVEVVNEHELNLVLDTAYTPFKENLTVGILPKHLWEELRTEELPFSEYNTDPVGSGPYQVTDIERSENGLIDTYHLTPAGDTDAYITDIEFKFFPTEDALLTALKDGVVDSTASLSYENIKKLDTGTFSTVEYPLPRTFTLFLNQNRSEALRETKVREALSSSIDREALIATVLDGYGYSTTSPIPPGFSKLESESTSTEPTEQTEDERVENARTLIAASGWTQNDTGNWEKVVDGATTTLSIKIATNNTQLFTDTANFLKDTWSKIGIEVEINQYDQADLVQSFIRPRDYQTLLFGTDVGRSLDLYPFWHSSQREDPGLNVAMYTNITTDSLLKTLRTSRDEEEIQKTLADIKAEITSETPAVFLYSPALVHVYRNDIHVEPIERLADASDRLSNIENWYVVKDRLWPIFTKDSE